MPTSSGTSTESPKRRVRMTRDARREQLLDAAARIVIEEGCGALTMEAVALATGASKTLGYAYFDNIAGLLLALYEREARTVAVAMRTAVDEVAGFTARFEAAAHVYLSHMEATGPLLVALAAGMQSGQLRLGTARPFDPVLDIVSQLIAEQYGFDQERARRSARYVGAVASIHAQLIWQGAESVADAEAELKAFVLGGLPALPRR